ncbi:transient receptor potential cation channel protein painless-like [Drosophila nasuta]|uniref:transient receptor potential cation channel protein painless-like n=1 Tax=Drosophila nasuta TaxID=42062 RepID=UPI00295EC68B|nr:transient receptor potential cation channel protein painless-like [Drosophila nasuta]
MSTGEYDASSANITSLWQYLLLFVFVIIVGISLFNLLVAKALNDIQLIQNQAEICSAIYRINIVKTYEKLSIVKYWITLTRLCKKPSHNLLKNITMRKFNYPLKMTFYYANIKDFEIAEKNSKEEQQTNEEEEKVLKKN